MYDTSYILCGQEILALCNGWEFAVATPFSLLTVDSSWWGFKGEGGGGGGRGGGGMSVGGRR